MKNRKVSAAEQLAAECPHCGARPGEACRTYRGTGKAACLERARPWITAAKDARKAEEINARNYPGLLAMLPEAADQAVSAADVRRAKQRAAAFAPENDFISTSPLNLGLSWVAVAAMERLAVQLHGEAGRRAVEYARRTYPMPDYGYHVWCDWLTGRKRTAVAVHAEPDPRPGLPNRVRLVEDVVYPPEGGATITADEFRARFHLDHGGGLADQPDDPEGLFERTIGQLRRVQQCGT